MKKLTTTLLLCSTFLFNSFGQEKFQKLIDRDFGTNNSISDFGQDVQQTVDGGYIISGYTNSFGIGSDDVFLVKLDQFGDTMWSNIYGTVQSEKGQKVVQTSDGGYAVAGYTAGATGGGDDIFLMKTNSTGTLQWSKTYGSSPDEALFGLEETTDNGFILVGKSEFQSGSWTYDDILVIKTDVNGDTLWTKIYGDFDGENDVIPRGITQTTDGGYAITGSGYAYTGGIYLIKLDATGDTSWARSYVGSGVWPEGYSIQQTSDGGYVMGAKIYTGGFGSTDWVLLKTDASGAISWSNVYGSASSSGVDNIIEAFETSDGGYFMGGVLDNAGVSSLSAIKTNSTGIMSWVKSYANQYGSFYSYEGYYGMTECSDGGFALTAEFSNQFGNTLEELYNGTDMLVVKTDQNGDSYGCQQAPAGVQEQAFALTENFAPFQDSSGVTIASNTFTEMATDINIMHSGVRLYMTSTAVTCGGTCDGEIEANPCDTTGFYCSGVNPYAYEWSDPSAQVTMTATGLCTGTYIVTVTDAFNCLGIDSVTLATTAPNQELCIVTVDETSTHNLLSWEKPITTGIDSFRIYRNIIGTYTWIGSVPYDSLSHFTDTTNGINPNTTSYRYKITALDTCGNESAMSGFHETIHLTTNVGTGSEINLIWDDYEGTMASFSITFSEILAE